MIFIPQKVVKPAGTMLSDALETKMLNRPDISNLQLAKLRYEASDFRVLSIGSHVLCAITGKAIPLDELKYWNAERQEAYIDAQASLEAEKKAGNLD